MGDFIEWDDAFSIGITEIDDQHKTLIGYINRLKSALDNKENHIETLRGVLAGLFNYTVYHFFAEEQIMETTQYPMYPKHKTEHMEFTNRVINYIEMFTDNKIDITEDVLNFLKQWLLTHIKHTDKALGNFLINKKP
ncbi:MAG: bacteriohemerythrin [Thermodesulfovibrionales bacterium]|nr:bacteriohemerythrin [Thermodesulfovibrionales bacterium]